MARPRLTVDESKIEALAAIGLTPDEIAAVIGCSRDTIDRRFADVLKKGHAKRDASLRRAQFDVAVNQKNPTMLIWLGKQFLGQRDKIEQGTPREFEEMSDDELRRIINAPTHEDREAAEAVDA